MAAAESAAGAAAEEECVLLDNEDAAVAGLIGTRIALRCESAPNEIGIIYLFQPGRQFVLFVNYGVGNDEDRFYVSTAIDSVEVAPTVP